jgi:hypothetical protein
MICQVSGSSLDAHTADAVASQNALGSLGAGDSTA